MNEYSADRFKRYGKPRPCGFKFTHRAVERNQHVGTCLCSTWSVFGVPSEKAARELWEIHKDQVASGTPPTPRLHQ